MIATKSIEAHDSAPDGNGILPPAVIIIATVCAFLTSFGGTFVFDDQANIIDNPQIRELWPLGSVVSNSSRPLVNFSLAVNYAISELNIWSYHLLNLIFHIVAALALFGIVRRTMFCEKLKATFGASANRLALAAALLWAIHPLQTQSVTYVIQRAESLMGMFYLLTLYCFIRGVNSNHKTRWHVATLFCCLSGMITKEVMITAPLVLILYDVCFISGSILHSFRRHWGRHLCLLSTALAPFALLAWNLSSDKPATAGFEYQACTPLQYALTQPAIILHYLQLSLWPTSLCFDYQWPIAQEKSGILLTSVVLGAFLLLTLWALWKRHWSGFWSIWFFLILSPTSSIMPIADLAFEHRMYLPLAGIIVLVVVGTFQLAIYIERRNTALAPLRKFVLPGVTAILAIVLTSLTYQRNTVYHSNLALWKDVITKRPLSARAHNNLGRAYADLGLQTQAIKLYQQALKLAPKLPQAHNNLGIAFSKQDQIDQAILCFEEAIRLQPDFPDPYCHLGRAMVKQGNDQKAAANFQEALHHRPSFPEAHNNLGSLLFRQNHLEQALNHFERALFMDPHNSDLHNNIGSVYLQQDNLDKATTFLLKAISLNPESIEINFNMGKLLARQGDIPQAIGFFKRTLKFDPQHANAFYYLGLVLDQQNKRSQARQYYARALQYEPHHMGAHKAISGILIQQNDLQQALVHCTKALEIDTKDAKAHNNMGLVLEKMGQFPEAIAHYSEALEINLEYAEAHNHLAILLIKQDELEQASHHLQEALRINPEFAEAHNNLGILLAMRGKIADAKVHFMEALRIKPDYTEAQTNLNKIPS